MPYSTVLFRMNLSDLGWLSKIFNDTKHCAVSLRQLSFLSSYVNWHISPCSQYGLELCTKFGSNIKYRLQSLRSTPFCSRHSFDDVTRINFRFRLLITWSSPHTRDASCHRIWWKYLYPSRSIDIFSEIQDGGCRHLGFLSYVNLAHFIMFIV